MKRSEDGRWRGRGTEKMMMMMMMMMKMMLFYLLLIFLSSIPIVEGQEGRVLHPIVHAEREPTKSLKSTLDPAQPNLDQPNHSQLNQDQPNHSQLNQDQPNLDQPNNSTIENLESHKELIHSQKISRQNSHDSEPSNHDSSHDSNHDSELSTHDSNLNKDSQPSNHDFHDSHHNSDPSIHDFDDSNHDFDPSNHDSSHDSNHDPSHDFNNNHDSLHDSSNDPHPRLVVQESRHRPGSVSMVIHKCCPERHVFDHTTNRCQMSRELTFSVPIFTVDYFGMYMESNLTRDQVVIWSDMLGCQKYLLDVIPEQKPEFDFRVLDTGQLWVPEYEHYYDPPHYCLDNFVRDASVHGSPHIQGAMVCILETEVETFDPSKIPVRKCCMHNEVYDTGSTSSCALRSNITSDPWLVPLRSRHTAPTSENIHLVDIRKQPYSKSHELVPNFQTCVGEQMGWQVEDFHVEEETGSLYIPMLDRVVPDNQYCIEDFHTNGTLIPMAYVCVSEVEKSLLQRLQIPGCQDEGACVAKCCPLGEVLDATSGRCAPAQEYYFSPILLLENGSYSTLMDADYQFGFPDCEVQLTYPHEGAELMERGVLRYLTNNTDECEPQRAFNIPQGHYCIDQVYYPSGEVKQGAGFCFKEHWEHLGGVEKQGVNYLYSAFLAISDFFILISFVVYLTVPDQNKRGLNKNVKLAHSVLGRILLCFLFSLFFAYLFLIIIKLFSDPINLASPTGCIAIGVCMYTFFMATFFWLNVLCFELWWKCARQERSSGRRWVWYQVYAWVCPLIFASVSLIMEFTPNISNCYIKPKFGTYSCFFSYSVSHNNGAKWAYFFGPVAVLLLADLVFFLLTVRSLLVTVQQSHKGTVQRQGRQRLKLCFKLFLVMGISWLAEIISFQLGPSTVWYISDVFNCFQGFIIFLIFILKPKILEAMRTRICGWCGYCGSPPPARPRGTNIFGSVVLSNSQSTDEFSLSNQLSFANHNRLTPTQSQVTHNRSIHSQSPVTHNRSIHSQSPVTHNRSIHSQSPVTHNRSIHSQSPVTHNRSTHSQSPVTHNRLNHSNSQATHNRSTHSQSPVTHNRSTHSQSDPSTILSARNLNGFKNSSAQRPSRDLGPPPPLPKRPPSSSTPSPNSSHPSTPRTNSTSTSLSTLSVEEDAC